MKKELTKDYLAGFSYIIELISYESSFDIFEEEDKTIKASKEIEDIKEWIGENILTPAIIIVKRDYNIDPPKTSINLHLKNEEDYQRVLQTFRGRINQ